jgi:hypothetical protein
MRRRRRNADERSRRPNERAAQDVQYPYHRRACRTAHLEEVLMYTLRYALAVGAAMLVAAPSAHAQLRRSTSTTYPDAQTLPAGMCRIWIDGVPANRQPAATDCATARRSQPRNSRIIYGTQRPTNVYGNRDPRSMPGTPQYDPRYDSRSSQYDPRLDQRNRGNDGRYDSNRDKEQQKWDRKQQKEREKEAKKSRRGNGHDDGDDHHDGNDDRGNRGGRDQYGQRGQQGQNGEYGDRSRNGTYGTTQQGCVDANRDGVCDNAQSSAQSIPRGIPQTVPQGTTRRVCVDANRDGRCDDGGPLVRVAP